jgi:hypothetical protein
MGFWIKDGRSDIHSFLNQQTSDIATMLNKEDENQGTNFESITTAVFM